MMRANKATLHIEFLDHEFSNFPVSYDNRETFRSRPTYLFLWGKKEKRQQKLLMGAALSGLGGCFNVTPKCTGLKIQTDTDHRK